MAKASYQCAECGASCQVTGYNRREADSLAAHREAQGAVCTECWQKRQAVVHQSDAERNAAADLPTLTGSQKQVAWAETIRAQQIARITEWAGRISADSFEDELSSRIIAVLRRPDGSEKIAAAVDHIKQQERASWWIDYRDGKPAILVSDAIRELADAPPPAATSTVPAAVDAIAEATIRPESPITDAVAEIRATADAVEIRLLEKREDFRQLVRFELGYTWADGAWRRKLNPIINGNPADRAAEAGHRLLSAGFPIRIFDESIRARAVAGDYPREQRRWVMAQTSGAFVGWFVIRWPKGDDFYAAARRLPGSRYADGCVFIPPEHFDQVQDFAQQHDFSLSPGAIKIVHEQQTIRERTLIVRPAPVGKTEPKRANAKPPKLEVPNDVRIDEDLSDE